MTKRITPANTGKNRDLPKEFIDRQFKPGQSGNPSGRPKTTPISDALRAACDNPRELTKIIKAIVKKAQAGDVKAFENIANRVEGRVTEQHEHSGKDGQPIVFRLERIAGS